MTFGERLTQLRKENGYITRKSFAEKINIPETTLRNYETNDREAGHTFLKQMSDFFNVSSDYLLGLTDEKEKFSSYQLKSSEYDQIEKYRSLDDYGKETVSFILERELHRTEQIRQSVDSSNTQATRVIQYYQKLASAGTGEVIFQDMPIDRIEIPDIPEYRRVSYAIGVNGHSMEPLYTDGDMLLVEPTCQIEIGEIGIFIIEDKAYVKKLGEKELISLNKGYNNISLTNDTKCMGHVVDKIKL